MPLDMFQGAQSDTDAYVRQHNAPNLPVGFGEAFETAWNENRLFGQSVAGQNARVSAMGDYLDDVTRRTGERFADLPAELQDPSLLMPFINDKVAKLNAANPDLKLEPLTEDGLNQRAVAKSREARAASADMAGREKTGGGAFGSFAGGAAGTITDPVNLVAAPLAAPEGLGLLGTALAWGAIAGGTQAAIEVTGAPYRDMVQPGYSQSAEPAKNIVESATFGGAAGGLFKGLGMAWTRAKTGEWPRSIRDAGNVVESEAQVAQTNVLPGTEGEVAHREALGKTIDDIVAGRKVEVPEDALAAHDAKLDALMGERAGAVAATQEAEAIRSGKSLTAKMFTPPDPLDLAMSGKLTADEASNIADRLKANQRDIENEIFGSETADEWRKLHRQSDRAWDNADDAKAKALDQKITELEQRVGITPEQDDWLNGSGWPEHTSPDDWKELSRNLRDIENGRDDAIGVAASELRYLPKTNDWSRMAGTERNAVITVLSAMNEEVRAGRDPQVFLRDVAQERVRRYGGGADAHEVTEYQLENLANFLKEGIQREGAPPPNAPLQISGPQMELPFKANAQEAKADAHEATIADGVQNMARMAGHDMPREEAEHIAQMVAKASTDEQARAILSTVADRPQTVAEFPPSPLPKEKGAEPLMPIEPRTVEQVAASPEHEAALRADIDRARAMGDVKIPVDVDKDGNVVMRSVDGAMEEVDAYKAAAEQIKACAAPQPEPAEAT